MVLIKYISDYLSHVTICINATALINTHVRLCNKLTLTKSWFLVL